MFALACVALLATSSVVFGEDGAAPATADQPAKASLDLESWVSEWRDAEPADRLALVLALKERGVNPAALAKALQAVPRFSSGDLELGETVTWSYESKGEREHTNFLYVPESYDPKKPMPMLVWLHGGVSMPRPNLGKMGISYFAKAAEKDGFLLLAPSAAGIPWWTEGGIAVIRDAMRHVAENYNVDADHTAAAGFSDGASGCYHLLQHMPEPFGCFLALLGHPLLTRMLGGPAFVTNAKCTPDLCGERRQGQLVSV